jgi:hypothetical protein
LYIWLKLSLGNAGNFSADSTKMLCLTTPGDTPASHRSLTRKETYSRHPTRSCFLYLDFYGIIAVKPHEYITSYLKCKCKASFFAENALFSKKTPLRHNFLDIIPEFDTLQRKRNEGAANSKSTESIAMSLRAQRSNLVSSLRFPVFTGTSLPQILTEKPILQN